MDRQIKELPIGEFEKRFKDSYKTLETIKDLKEFLNQIPDNISLCRKTVVRGHREYDKVFPALIFNALIYTDNNEISDILI